MTKKSQVQNFRETARKLGCDESEEAFDATLAKLARGVGQTDPHEKMGKATPKKRKQK